MLFLRQVWGRLCFAVRGGGGVWAARFFLLRVGGFTMEKLSCGELDRRNCGLGLRVEGIHARIYTIYIYIYI